VLRVYHSSLYRWPLTQLSDLTEWWKVAPREVWAVLAATQAMGHDTPCHCAETLIPKPHGTSGRCGELTTSVCLSVPQPLQKPGRFSKR